MEQQTGSKLGNEYIKAVYCHPAYCRVHHVNARLDKIQAEVNISERNINNLRHHPYGRKRRTKEPLDESERGE